MLEFKARLYESLVGGMLTKEEYASYKAKYTKQAEDIRESVRVLKEKLTEILENRSERNRWISQFTQFSTLETLDRRALIHMVQSIRVRGKKELDITFTHEDEQTRQDSRKEASKAIFDADTLTTELAELLIDRVLVYPDKRIEVAYKIQDIFD